MASRRLEFFMRLAEAEGLVEAWRLEQGLHGVLEAWQPHRFEPVRCRDLRMADGTPAGRVWLLAKPPDSAALEAGRLAPLQTGYVLFSLPREVGQVLYQATLGSRSDWFDDDWERVREQPVSLELFKSVAPRVRRLLKHPVWAIDVPSGKARPYRTLGYTAGVEVWVSVGGRLAQEGVATSASRSRTPPDPAPVPEGPRGVRFAEPPRPE